MALWQGADGAICKTSGIESNLKPKLARWGLGVLTHPFVILRHQSQLHILYHSWPNPVAPFTDVQSLYTIWAAQGVSGLWRGSATLYGGLFCFELLQGGLISLYEHTRKSKERMSFNVVYAIRLVSYAVATPFMTGILVSSVQYAAQKIYCGGLSTIPELAFERPFWQGLAGGVFSTLSLAVPTVFICLIRSVVSSIARDVTYRILKNLRQKAGAIDRAEPFSLDVDDLCAGMAGSFLADVVTYPMETSLVRAHMQGFPVLMDDIEHGQSPLLLPLSYKGWYDLFFTVRTMEGRWGFYKGFSAMLLQRLAQGLVLFGLHRWSFKTNL